MMMPAIAPLTALPVFYLCTVLSKATVKASIHPTLSFMVTVLLANRIELPFFYFAICTCNNHAAAGPGWSTWAV